jgi:hypothetical protein
MPTRFAAEARVRFGSAILLIIYVFSVSIGYIPISKKVNRKASLIMRGNTHYIGKPAINFFSLYELVQAQKAAKVAKNSYKSKS